jgi:hypothetical protein
VNNDCHLIYEAYTSQGTPAVSLNTATTNLSPKVSTPVTPPPSVTSMSKTENEEKPKKTKTITLEDINTDRKAIHAAYDIVEAIYRTVDGLDRATQVVQAIASVHRNERKRLAKKT